MSAVLIDLHDDVREALQFISPNLQRDEWVKVGMAIKSEFGDAGFDLFNDWSKDGDNYNEAGVRSTWRSIKAGGGVTIKTLFKLARDGGYRSSANPAPRVIDPEESKQREEARQRQEKERQKQRSEGSRTSALLWSEGEATKPDHPYPVRKRQQPTDTIKELHVDRAAAILGYRPTATVNDKKVPLVGRLLLVPYLKKEDGKRCITAIEMIDETGAKVLNWGSDRSGAYWSPVKMPQSGSVQQILIGEGMATALTVYRATGILSLAAGSASNLPAVAQTLRAEYPEAELGLLSDLGNGEAQAGKAARLVGARLIKPILPEASTGTDFNDLACDDEECGMEKLKAIIEQAMANDPVLEPLPVDAANELVSFRHGEGQFTVNQTGVWYQAPPNSNGVTPAPQWVCAELHVVAQTRTSKSEEWGRMLVWHDEDGVRHQWAMPNELLQGDGLVVRQELSRLGLQMAHGRAARELLSSYLSVCPCDARARCVDRMGWHGTIYVTPSESIGQENEIVVFQNAQAIEPALSVSGSVESWKDSVAALAKGNSRLVFALSVAFGAPIVEVVGADSGGIHFRGKSSSGKTTALKVAASVWGDPNTYPRLWRATTNGLEGLAALHNDGLLILDELSQIAAKDVGDSAYLLANGQGKSRASKSGNARQAARWRLLFLSAGEESLVAMMAKAGKKANAGQEIRLADIEADAGVGMGIFEELHGQLTPSAMALAIKDAAASNHGAAGMAWLRLIVSDRPALADFIKQGIDQFTKEVVPANAEGQVVRVGQRFGLVAMAGELATHYGLTGWSQNEAIEAAKKCFSAWLASFGGTGNREDRALLSQVKAFFELHGSARFEDWVNASGRVVNNRAGFRKVDTEGQVTFYVLPEAFKEICKGFDPKVAAKALASAGWIAPDRSGGYQQKPRLPEMPASRCYVFTPRMWEDDHAT